jgi:hypothetical protein
VAITRLRRFLRRIEPTHEFSGLRYLGAEVDPFQPNLAQSWSMQSKAAHRLAITFGLTVADVRVDAHDVATWRGTDDDLAALIGARRRLGMQDAATYHRNLRAALGQAR